MIDFMIMQSHIPMAVNQAIARDMGLILQTNGIQTIAADRVLEKSGFVPVRTAYKIHAKNRDGDINPEAV